MSIPAALWATTLLTCQPASVQRGASAHHLLRQQIGPSSPTPLAPATTGFTTGLARHHLRHWHGMTCSSEGCVRAHSPPDPLTRFFSAPCKALAGTGIINARCEGARGDGTTDDTDVLQGLLTAPYGERIVLLPPGTYPISKPLGMVGGRKLLGAGRETIITVSESVEQPLPTVITTVYANEVLDLTIDARFRARTGYRFFKNHTLGGQIRGVTVRRALEDGFFCDFSMGGVVERVSSQENGRDGFRFNSCNAELVLGLTSASNGGHGVRVTGAPSSLGVSASGGVHLAGGNVSGNGGDGVVISGTKSFTVVEDFVIRNRGDGIRVEDETTLYAVRRNDVGTDGKTTIGGRALRVQGSSYNGFIFENELQSSLVKQYARVVLEDGVTDTHVVGNFVSAPAGVRSAPIDYNNRNVVAFIPYGRFLTAPLELPLTHETTLRALAFAEGPPSGGQWEPGDIVLNAGSPRRRLGWICERDDGGPCQWTSLNNGDSATTDTPVAPPPDDRRPEASVPKPPISDAKPKPQRTKGPAPGSAPPTSAACNALHAIGILDLRCFGARGNGVDDDTGAFEAALETASASHALYIPPGHYLLSRTLDIGNKHVFGAGFSSILRVSDSLTEHMSAVLFATAGTRLERLLVDAAQRAERGILISKASESPTLVRRVRVRGATGPGLHVLRAVDATLEAVGVHGSGAGMVIEESSRVTLLGVHAHWNHGDALVVLGDGSAVHSATRADIHVFHASFSHNRGRPFVVKDRARPTVAEYLWIENIGDAVWLHGVHNAAIRYTRALGATGDNRAFRITGNSSNLLLEANAANRSRGNASAEQYARSNSIFIESGCRDIRLMGNVFDSQFVRLPLAVTASDRVLRTTGPVDYRSGGQSRGLLTYRDAPPPSGGRWQPGDLVLRPEPNSSAPKGWVCVEAEGGCRWEQVVLDVEP